MRQLRLTRSHRPIPRFLPLAFLLLLLNLSGLGAATLNPVAWGLFADGGGGPIDGITDYSEVNGRVFVGYSTTLPEIFRGVYEFDALTYRLNPVSAVLSLRVNGIVEPGSLPVQLFGYIGNGTADGSDYAAGSLLGSFNLSTTGLQELDVSGFVTSALLADKRYLGFTLRPNGDPYTDHAAYQLGSPNHGPTSTLGITVVPEPGVAGLLVAGLGISLLRHRRLRAHRD